MNSRSRRSFGLVIAMAFAVRANAADGRIEINQSAALAGGVTSCDTPGFPVTLCKSGAYVLTSDLDYDGTASGGIVATVDDVSIDLNGMAVRGTNVCTVGASGWVVGGCGGGTNHGVQLGARSVVENGRVIGARGVGVLMDDGGAARDLIISDCADSGMLVSGRARVTRITSRRNASRGFSLGTVVARDIVALQNGSDGLFVGNSSTIENVTASQNASIGIWLSQGSRLAGFTSERNAAQGLLAQDGAVVDSGSIRDNGVSNANAFGLFGFGGASFRGVNITASAGGNPSTTSGMANAGGNFCQGVPCP